jgi:hypothetical protein
VASRPEAFLTSGAMPLGNCPASAGGCRLFQKTLAFLLFNPTRQPRVTGEVRGLLADRQWSPNGHRGPRPRDVANLKGRRTEPRWRLKRMACALWHGGLR